MPIYDESELRRMAADYLRCYETDVVGEIVLDADTNHEVVVDWMDIYRFDPDLADDTLTNTDAVRKSIKTALESVDAVAMSDYETLEVRIENTGSGYNTPGYGGAD